MRKQTTGIIMYIKLLNISLTGPPDPPVIQRALTRVTAVSVYLVWASGFNGGSTQTFTVICQAHSASSPIIIEDIPDPINDNEVSLLVRNLNEKTEYSFTVRTNNMYPGESTATSETEMFVTNGKHLKSLGKI